MKREVKRIDGDGDTEEPMVDALQTVKEVESAKKSIKIAEQIIRKEHSPFLEGLNSKEKKKVKKILQSTEPSEYFGQDYTKLEDLIKILMKHNFVKSDKKLSKKMTRLDEANIKMIATAAKLRKDYETLYSQIRNIIYPGKGGSLTEEGDE